MHHYKRLIPFLFLLPALAMGQGNLPYNQDITGYRGNPVQSAPLGISISDTLLAITVLGTETALPSSQTVSPQPTAVRSGTTVVVSYASSSTLPTVSYYRLSIGGVVRYSGRVTIGVTGVVLPPITASIYSQISSQLSSLQTLYAQLGPTVTANTTAINLRLLTSVYNTNRTTDLLQLTTHTESANNPHSVSKAQVGLPLADNTPDSSKPVSGPQQTAINAKQATLVSGTNIKTLNGASLLGSTDIVIPVVTDNSQLANGAGYATTGELTTAISNVEPGILKFATYADAVVGLLGRTKPARVLIASDTVNNGGGFGKYDYDGTTLIEDIL